MDYPRLIIEPYSWFYFFTFSSAEKSYSKASKYQKLNVPEKMTEAHSIFFHQWVRKSFGQMLQQIWNPHSVLLWLLKPFLLSWNEATSVIGYSNFPHSNSLYTFQNHNAELPLNTNGSTATIILKFQRFYSRMCNVLSATKTKTKPTQNSSS